MSEWLLRTFSTWFLVAIVLGGATALAACGCVLFRHRASGLVDATDDTVTGVIVSILAGIYGIILAFVIVVLWQGYQDAQGVVSDEANALSQLARNIEGFPPAQHAAIASALAVYVRSVVRDDWPAMQHGRDSERTSAALERLYGAVQTYTPSEPARVAFYDRSTENLEELAARRRQRIGLSQHGLPGVLGALMVGGALLIVWFTYFFSVPRQSVHIVMSGGVALLLAFNLLLALLLQNPFAGEISVSSGVFRSGVLAQVWR